MTGVGGQWSRATFTTQLVGNLGMNGGELYGWLASHAGLFPMVFADDAVVVESTLTLMAAPVPEPAGIASMLAGLAAIGAVMRRRTRRD
ncbi:MAG: PEP-CTERM sorting domain-containing protein [Rubrivivax sp.]|nr:PEP-CTERM sorting domain-containing protein [Rubrivivax sp.]